ncbi:MAG: hypothetical protein ACLTEH_02850 [Clostridia bacterium]|jgi:3-isopropylmalate dehydratase small subunit
MKWIKKVKSNKGVMGTDIVVSLVVLTLFAGVIASLFADVFFQNVSIRMNALATNYAIKILEDTDKMSYIDVTQEQMNKNLTNKYGISSNYNVTVKVENYSDMVSNKKDIIKIITVTVKYTLKDQPYTYTVKKLKIREM